MAKCPVCNQKIGTLLKSKTSDGVVCINCATITNSVENTNIKQLQSYWEENNKRFSTFSKTSEQKGLMSETLTCDDNNKLFYIGKSDKLKTQPIVYRYDEVESYEIVSVGGKTVTKAKPGLIRPKLETKEDVGATKFLHVNVNTGAGTKLLSMTNLNLAAFFKKCIEDNQNNKQADVAPVISSADEILKFKELMDQGIISEDEFETKKKQLLGI